MGLTIQHLNSGVTQGSPITSQYPGQIAIRTAFPNPGIWLSQLSSVNPCWVSETKPNPVGAPQGGLWFRSSDNQLLVGVDSEYKPVFGNLFGCTDANTTALGAWDGGVLSATSPSFMTCISTRNPTNRFLTQSRSVLINSGPTTVPLDGGNDIDRQYVLINGGDNYTDNVPIGSVSILGYGSSGADGSVRVGSRSGQNYSISGGNNSFTVVGRDAAYDVKGNIYAITAFGGGRDTNPVDSQFTSTFFRGPNTPYDSNRGGYRKSNNLTLFGTGGEFPPLLAAYSDVMGIGVGCFPGLRGTAIARGQSTDTAGCNVISNGTFPVKWVTSGVHIGGIPQTAFQTGSFAVSLSNGLGEVMFHIGDDMRFKDYGNPGDGNVLVSGGPTSCPKWQPVVKSFTFSSSDRKIVTITNGLVTNIES